MYKKRLKVAIAYFKITLSQRSNFSHNSLCQAETRTETPSNYSSETLPLGSRCSGEVTEKNTEVLNLSIRCRGQKSNRVYSEYKTCYCSNLLDSLLVYVTRDRHRIMWLHGRYWRRNPVLRVTACTPRAKQAQAKHITLKSKEFSAGAGKVEVAKRRNPLAAPEYSTWAWSPAIANILRGLVSLF
jgi:hypothetical protein